MLVKSKQSLLSIILVLYIIFAPAFLFPQIAIDTQFLNRENTISYYGVLELWHIDTFEGGSASRAWWLEQRALEFERKNPGTYIIVRTMSQEQAVLNLENGTKPSMISYGLGVGASILSELTSYNRLINVRDDLIKSGKINGAIMAMPYILGGYSLITNEVLLNETSNEQSVLNKVFSTTLQKTKAKIPAVSFAGNSYSNAPLALYFNTSSVANASDLDSDYLEKDQYLAYEDFVLRNSSVNLIGTQRDFYRCENRNSNKADEEYSFEYLKGFSDLIQYISIFKSDTTKQEKCAEFIEYITSETAQKTLTDISMFSTIQANIYSSGEYKKWEEVLASELKTFNVFLNNEVIKYNIELAVKALMGEEEAKNKINKMF